MTRTGFCIYRSESLRDRALATAVLDPADKIAEPSAESASRARMAVVAGDLESAAGVAAILQHGPGLALCVERLPLRDYRVDDNLNVERKTLVDLVQSIRDGRLFSQALRLAIAPVRAAIILEGRGPDLAASRMRREAIRGALAMLTLQMGLPLLRAANPEETAALILLRARQLRACVHGALPRHGRRPRGKAGLRSHILQATSSKDYPESAPAAPRGSSSAWAASRP